MLTERRTAWVALLVLGLWIGAGRTAAAPALLDQKGKLTDESGKLDSGEFAEPLTLQVKAGQVLGVRLMAVGFTPYMIATMGEAAKLDASGHGDSAMLLLVAPVAGELRLVVTTDKVGEKGSFRLIVTEGAVDGRLGPGDDKLESGELNDLIPAWVPAGAKLTTTCASTEFDAYLLYHAGEKKLEVDDSVGLGTNAQVVMEGDPAGAQQLQVTTHKPGESGAYRIQVAEGEPDQAGTNRSAARLSKGDPTLPGGEFFHSYGFYAVAGHAYTIAAQSKQVDTYLILKEAGGARHENDDHQGQTDAQIVFEAATTGLARIVVTSSKVGEEGAYALVVSAGGAGATRTLLAENGALDANDKKMDSGEFFDRYEVDVPTDRRVTVRAESKAFDTYVILEVPGAAEQSENDDEKPGVSDSRVTVTPTKAGKMTVYVTSAQAGQTGDYALSVVLEAAQQASEASAGALQLGGTLNGSLAAGDATLESGEFYDKYTLTGKAGQSIKVTATSRAFDTYLIVQAPGGRNLDNDDLEGLDHASQVTFEFPEDGDATVVVTSAQKGESGAYTLGCELAQTAGPRVGDGAAITVGSFIEGSLATDDNKLESGELYDVQQLDAEAGKSYTINLVSTEFDAYLIVIKPDRSQEDNDNEGSTSSSRLELRTPAAGRYQIVATSAKPGVTGHYTLSIQAAGENRSGAAAGAGPATSLGGASQHKEGKLEDGDERLSSGELADYYDVSVNAGQWLEVKLSAAGLDPYLIVIGPDGKQQENDDLQDNDSTAGVRLQVARGGTCKVVATSYRPGEKGAYELVIVIGGTPTTPVPEGPKDRRYFGVFAGIDKYPRSPLRFCADDARNMAATFAQEHIVTEANERILTDKEATTAAIKNAILDVGRTAGPQDMLMFFFSGHGGQTAESADIPEADQRWEYIVTIDGSIKDYEMSQLFDQLRCGLSLIYLDSCFSGGFASNVISKPGRMGIFSSDEDLTSNVASKFRAGGYLSHFMLKAIQGAADSDHNKDITAAELSYYMENSFMTECADLQSVSMQDDRGYQRVRVSRGGVKLGTTLFVLP